ncbi:MAG: recombination mediator RecR [Prevotellaceae bacterium]|nr:recombination mediator RecR [Prevotellaceae bacterium]MDY2749404.1 recombination mediator RecR [Prevotella sp.]
MPSTLLDNAVSQFSRLPGIGHKTALRLVLHLLRQDTDDVVAFADSLTTLKREVKYCKVCHNISDTELCPICADRSRDASLVCVVENIQDVMAIERTQQYRGLYHVLGGIISPMDGIGPGDIEIESLVRRIADNREASSGGAENTVPVREVIFALASTMEGDTTNFYISRRLQVFPDLRLSVIARGISVGDELQYADEVTLGRSILNRTPL